VRGGWYILRPMSDLAGLPVEPEPAPKALRVLAMAQNLGVLRSVHEPASRLARLQFRSGKIYVFDGGLVLASSTGGLRLFRWAQVTLRKAGRRCLIMVDGGGTLGPSKGWSRQAELEQAIAAGAEQDQ
jgi:hypothetical protein